MLAIYTNYNAYGGIIRIEARLEFTTERRQAVVFVSAPVGKRIAACDNMSLKLKLIGWTTTTNHSHMASFP